MDAEHIHNVFIDYKVCREQFLPKLLSLVIRINIDKVPAQFKGVPGTLFLSLNDKDVNQLCNFFTRAGEHYQFKVKNILKGEVYIIGTRICVTSLLVLEDKNREV